MSWSSWFRRSRAGPRVGSPGAPSRETLDRVLSLSDPQRTVLLYHLVGGLEPSAIAPRAGLTPECVERAMEQGLRNVRGDDEPTKGRAS